MKEFLYLSVFLIFGSCQFEEQQEIRSQKSVPQKPVKLFSGKPDLPENGKQITSAGIGKIILGDPLINVDQLYDSILNITLYKEGGEWPAKKVILGDGQWIIAESVNSVNQITGVYTNHKEFRTSEGYSIGMPLDSISSLGDSIAADPSQKAFFLYKSGVFFKIDPSSEKLYFKSSSSPARLKSATIDEFFIICGDC